MPSGSHLTRTGSAAAAVPRMAPIFKWQDLFADSYSDFRENRLFQGLRRFGGDELFYLRQNAFHFFPAEGAHRLGLNVAQRTELEGKSSDALII